MHSNTNTTTSTTLTATSPKNDFDHEKSAAGNGIIEASLMRSSAHFHSNIKEASIIQGGHEMDATRRGNSQAGDVTGLSELLRVSDPGAAVAGEVVPNPQIHDAGRDRNNGFGDDTKATDEGRRFTSGFANEKKDVAALPISSVETEDDLARTQRIFKSVKDAIQGVRISLNSDQHQYADMANRIQQKFTQRSGDVLQRWKKVLIFYAANKNSYSYACAAIRWQLKTELVNAMVVLPDGLDRLPTQSMDERWLTEMERRIESLNALSSIKRSALVSEYGIGTRKKQSQRDDLKSLPEKWQDKIVAAAAGKKYQDAIALLALTGCRPQELVNKIEIDMSVNPCEIKIHGAKVVEGRSGQAWRILKFSWDALPAHFVESACDGHQSHIVDIQSTDALRQALYAISDELWPGGIRVSPYHFRHAFAENLRENGWPAHEMAEAMGELSAETVSHYGRRIRPKRGRKAPATFLERGNVLVPNPVKHLTIFGSKKMKNGQSIDKKEAARRLKPGA